MLNAGLDKSMESAMRQLNLQRPNGNIRTRLANVSINANLIDTYSNSLQTILERLHPIAGHTTIHSRRQRKVLQNEVKATQQRLVQTAQSPTHSCTDTTSSKA